jgi:hypothetical protein
MNRPYPHAASSYSPPPPPQLALQSQLDLRLLSWPYSPNWTFASSAGPTVPIGLSPPQLALQSQLDLRLLSWPYSPNWTFASSVGPTVPIGLSPPQLALQSQLDLRLLSCLLSFIPIPRFFPPVRNYFLLICPNAFPPSRSWSCSCRCTVRSTGENLRTFSGDGALTIQTCHSSEGDSVPILCSLSSARISSSTGRHSFKCNPPRVQKNGAVRTPRSREDGIRNSRQCLARRK